MIRQNAIRTAARHPALRRVTVLLLALAMLPARGQDANPDAATLRAEYDAHIQPLLQNYCYRCHNREEDSGSNIRLDSLSPELTVQNSAQWMKIKNMLDVGSMPPKKQTLRPSREELDRMLSWIGTSLKRFESQQQDTRGDTLLRRINNRAYANMVTTLLGVPAQNTDEFPTDGDVHGYDTVGAALYTNAYLYETYLKCAQKTLDLAITTRDTPPPTISDTLNYHNARVGFVHGFRGWVEAELNELEKDPARFSKIADDFINRHPAGARCAQRLVNDVVAAHYGENTFQDVEAKKIAWADDPECRAKILAAFRAEVQHLSKIETEVSRFQSLTRNRPDYGSDLKLDVTDAGYYVLGARLYTSHLNTPQWVRFCCGNDVAWQFTVYDPESAPHVYEKKMFLAPGLNNFELLARKWKGNGGGTGTRIRYDSLEALNHHVRFGMGLPVYCGVSPEVMVDEFYVRGPVYESWPPPSTTRIFTRGVHAPPSCEYAEEIVTTFMRRAYAGRVDAGAARPFVDLIMLRYEAEKDFVEAVKFGLASILISPRFLYLDETQRTDPAQRRPLDAYELARRLAYFVWSDLPDETLVASAASGALLDEKELLNQLHRMLKDPRSSAFRKAFTTQWLKITRFRTIPVLPELFPAYDDILVDAAEAESIAFFSELLDKDLSLLNFIDSDFLMLNGRLAEHYGIPGVTGNEMQHVPNPPGSHRGGVLTQASVLIATSNGMVTSPVKRGAFVMDRLLGVPPGVPPPNVPPLDKTPAMREDGSMLTPRERLAQHRENMSCARCHDRIDPLGVSLEHFNAVGKWTTNLEILHPSTKPTEPPHWTRHKADVTGAMLDGEAFDGSDELKHMLMKHKDQFVRCFAENLAIYTLGRELQPSDAPIIEGLCARVAARGYGLGTLVDELVLSDLFRKK